MSDDDEPLTDDPALASLLRRVAAAPAPPRAAFLTAAALEPGTAIDDRYVIEGVLGSGGMGVVYLAEHRRLKRKIALKLTRTGDPLDNERLLREARAVAAVDHEHVVEIHDVGRAYGQVFIAMELLDGGTGRTWVGERVRSVHEVVALYRAAGEGLAAAHAHLLVHRDFKPDNVLVGRDGRVCVADFGLAQSGSRDSPGSPSTEGDSPVSVRSRPTTAGTPPYMAPEVRRGQPATVYSDQYSYCVSLREALLGSTRPVSLGGPIWPDDASCPRWLRRVVERGLSEDPEARFATMEALCVALQGPSRRRWGIAALFGAVAVVPLMFQSETPCSGVQGALDGVWDREVQHDLRAAFERSNTPGADATWRWVEPKLDRWAKDWLDARHDACVASTATDLRVDCLEHHRQVFEATVDMLGVADRDVVMRATEIAGSLPPVGACEDEKQLASRSTIPAEHRHQAEQIRALLAVAAAQERASKLDTAETLAADAMARARSLGVPLLIAEACYGLGDVLRTARHWDEVQRVAEEGLGAASAAHDDGLAARLALMRVAAAVYAPDNDAQTLLRTAEALVARAGSEDLQTSLTYTQALVARSVGRQDEAIAKLREVLLLSDDPVQSAKVRSTLAEALRHADRYDEALAMYDENIAELARTLGPDHRLVAQDLNNAGGLELMRDGDPAVARPRLERALEIRRALFGPDARVTAETLVNLGQVMTKQGELDRAREMLDLAAAGFASSVNGRAYLLSAQAELAKASGDTARAVELMRERVEHLERHFPPGHVMRIQASYNLAGSEFDRGADERARRIVDAALTELTGQDADPGLLLGALLSMSGTVAHAMGEHGRAAIDLAAAVAVFDAIPEAPATFAVEPLENGGMLLLELGQTELGLAWLRRAVEVIDETDPDRAVELEARIAAVIAGADSESTAP